MGFSFSQIKTTDWQLQLSFPKRKTAQLLPEVCQLNLAGPWFCAIRGSWLKWSTSLLLFLSDYPPDSSTPWIHQKESNEGTYSDKRQHEEKSGNRWSTSLAAMERKKVIWLKLLNIFYPLILFSCASPPSSKILTANEYSMPGSEFEALQDVPFMRQMLLHVVKISSP